MNKSTRIALINPESQFLIDQGVMPPLGLWYIMSSLKKNGYKNVEFFDLGLGDIIPDGFDLYAVSATTPQWKVALELLPEISKKGITIIGGSHVTLKRQDGIDSGYDFIFIGEGEHLNTYLSLKSKERVIVADKIKDLNNIPFPDRTNIARYSYLINGIEATTMMTSRGCPFNCAFCCKGVWGRTYRERSPDNVIEEVNILMDQYGYNAIMFFDDTFMVNIKRLEKLCKHFKKRNLTWRAFGRSDQLSLEIATMMKDSGCVEVGIGIETGSQRIANGINKNESVDVQKKAIANCKSVGLKVKAFMIIGLPGEDEESIKETERFVEETQPDDIDFSILSVLPGSDIYNHPEKYDIEFGEPTFYKGKPGEYNCQVRTSALSSEMIVEARERLFTKFKKQ